MGNTPAYALPYPEPSDRADVPTDMREMGEAIDRLQPLFAFVEANQGTTTINVWVDLATGGPAITAPRTGDYLALASATGIAPSDGPTKLAIGIARGQTNPSSILYVCWLELIPSGATTMSIGPALINLTAGTQALLRYWTNRANTQWEARQLTLFPLRSA